MHFKQFLETIKLKQEEDKTVSLVEEVTKEIYEEIPNNKIAEIIEWCLSQPHNIEIQQLTILPTTQRKISLSKIG